MTGVLSEEIIQRAEQAEGAAWVDIFQAAPGSFMQQHQCRQARLAGSYASLLGVLNTAFFNRVSCLGLSELATMAGLDEIQAYYAAAGNQEHMIQLSPLAQPAALPGWLAERGYQARGNWAKFVRPADPQPGPDTSLTVKCIGPEAGADFARLAREIFEMPALLEPWMQALVGRANWKHYQAYDGDQPVGVAALYIHGDTGWLGFGAVQSSHRRRGGQGALIAARILDAHANGCSWVTTETGDESPEEPNHSYRNMLRSGFSLAYLRPNYVYRP